MRQGINLEHIQVIMQKNIQIMISDCLLLVMILMNPRILIHEDLRLFVSNVALSTETDDVDVWFVDSGASIHMTCNNKWYANFKETQNGASIYLGDDRHSSDQGIQRYSSNIFEWYCSSHSQCCVCTGDKEKIDLCVHNYRLELEG
jgi:hypothetical protein